VAERAGGGHPGVGDAVERDTTGHRQRVRAAGGLVQPGGKLADDLLQADLHAGGEIGVTVGDLPVRRSGLGEAVPVHRGDGEAAVRGGPDQVTELVKVGRAAVGGQRHDLVLVAGVQEPEVAGQTLVEQAERVGQLLRGQHLEVIAAVHAGQVARDLAATVEHENRGAVPAGAARCRKGG
jgi:hypothetical protein